VTSYSLVAPVTYVALSGEVRVIYRLPHQANNNVTSSVPVFRGAVRLVELPTRRPLTTVDIPPEYRDGEVTFTCGLVDHAGTFVFQLIDKTQQGTGQGQNSTLLAESNEMTVRWPRLTITMPMTHDALTDDVDVQLTLTEATCESVSSMARYSLLVVYSLTTDDGGDTSSSDFTVTVYNETVTRLMPLNRVVRTLPCGVFDHAGSYTVQLTSSYDVTGSVVSSNTMVTGWGDYAVRATASTILPCYPTKVRV
jgi:hypothetical protein